MEGLKEKVTALADKGMPLLKKGEYTGGRYAYIDTFRDLKVIIELLEKDTPRADGCLSEAAEFLG